MGVANSPGVAKLSLIDPLAFFGSFRAELDLVLALEEAAAAGLFLQASCPLSFSQEHDEELEGAGGL